MSANRLLCGLGSRRAAASPLETMPIECRAGERRSVFMRELHGVRAAQSLDRSLTGSLLCPLGNTLREMAASFQAGEPGRGVRDVFGLSAPGFALACRENETGVSSDT